MTDRWERIGELKRGEALGIMSAGIRQYFSHKHIQAGDSQKHSGCKYVGWRDKEGDFHTCEVWMYVCHDHVGYHKCGCQGTEADAILEEVLLRR